MFTYTECRECGNLLQVTNHDTTHTGCQPHPTKPERLAHAWLAAILDDDQHTADQLQNEIDIVDHQPPRLKDAALRYAAWGWPVFPLKTHSKQPATRHGFKDATTNPDRITAWWNRHPNHNIGLPTGNTFDVIDIDVPQGALSYARMLAMIDPRTGRGPLPTCHGQVATASGGIHLYVKPAPQGNKAGLMPGIDLRGAGGYVVAPPSTLGQRHKSWSWTVAPSPAIKGQR